MSNKKNLIYDSDDFYVEVSKDEGNIVIEVTEEWEDENEMPRSRTDHIRIPFDVSDTIMKGVQSKIKEYRDYPPIDPPKPKFEEHQVVIFNHRVWSVRALHYAHFSNEWVYEIVGNGEVTSARESKLYAFSTIRF